MLPVGAELGSVGFFGGQNSMQQNNSISMAAFLGMTRWKREIIVVVLGAGFFGLLFKTYSSGTHLLRSESRKPLTWQAETFDVAQLQTDH